MHVHGFWGPYIIENALLHIEPQFFLCVQSIVLLVLTGEKIYERHLSRCVEELATMLLRRRQRVLPVFRNYRFFAVEANLDHENVAQIPTNEQTITVAPPVKPTTSMLATQRQQFLEKQRHTPTVTVRTPILIVGASPAGATLSALLGSMHIPHLLVDRTPSLDALKLRPSQEHVLSRRSLESKKTPQHSSHVALFLVGPFNRQIYIIYLYDREKSECVVLVCTSQFSARWSA